MDNEEIVSPNELDATSLFALGSDTIGLDHGFNDGSFSELTAALTAAQTAPSSYDDIWATDSTFRDLLNQSTALSSPITPGTPITGPKLGARFSRDVIRTLKNWLAVHQRHPYPNDEEMNALQNRTGLNKAQLTNWFANARRRGKMQSIRPTSPQVQNISTNPIDIIPRPPTPAFRSPSDLRNPMQRWEDSPPEHEPAAFQDIARAVASNTTHAPPEGLANDFDYMQQDPWASPYDRSSASSGGTSQSSDFSSYRSSESQSSLKQRRTPRRKRVGRGRHIGTDRIPDPNLPYQCTFCTDIFKTKHDWQRHEKSLHLPLEQWICALHGPRAPKKDVAELCCVFCGEPSPDEAHMKTHHYHVCQERDPEERTFHRKDHLVQHLRLVHNSKYAGWSMSSWMVPIPKIRSRCGFCGITMKTWTERIDHLADHFKLGQTMAEWQGDWGFDEATIKMVESAVPPYFIDYERSTVVPMKASDPPWGSPPNAYELLKIEMEQFVQVYFDKSGQLPSNQCLQLEACRIIFAAETFSLTQGTMVEVIHPSWLRDLIMSSPELTNQARFGPLRTSKESRHLTLSINGQDHLFEQCPLELQLQAFVTGQQLQGMVPDDARICKETCDIVRRMETASRMPSDIFANWVVKGIYSGTDWLREFKERTGIQSSRDFPIMTGSTIPALEWNISDPMTSLFPLPAPTATSLHFPTPTTSSQLPDAPPTTFAEPPLPSSQPIATASSTRRPGGLLPDDTNFFRCFEKDLKRWVAATMSPRNPSSHVPSDEEIQHQARWIMYGGDDSWNQTPADFQEWLWHFKRDVGITKDGDGVGVELGE